MMGDNPLLQELLAKPSSLVLDDDGTLVLKLAACTEEDRQFLQVLLQQAQAGLVVDYRPYFAEIRAYPLFKPTNPVLAIRHVAKQHGLDVAALTVAFRGEL